ncbi:CHAT domain-containing protein [Streptomyces sp. DSM 116496]|uniref:CHAT domain-containing protein n=1 Tax=Streptomyces stoeckheimensis TaxID=3344656 RepID=UPI0038B3B52F
MSGEENGGVEGLRTWVSDAIERVKRQLPGMGGGPLSPHASMASVAELDQLARLLDHDEALRGSVNVWLAGALTLRDAAGAGSAGDRERAERLLRDARDRTAPLGAVVTREEQRWAALFLMSHVTPVQPQQGHFATAPDLSGYLDWLRQAGTAGMVAKAAELGTLMNEAAELSLSPELLGPLRQAQALFAAPSAQGLSDLLAGMVPPGSPFADQLNQMVDGMFGAMASAGPSSAAPPGPVWERDVDPDPVQEQEQEQEQEQDPKPDPQSKPDPQPAPEAKPAPDPGPRSPLDPEAFRNMVAALDAVNATSQGLDSLLGSGDPHALNELLQRLRSVQDLPMPGLESATGALESLRALLLSISSTVGGSYQDLSAGRAHIGAVADHLERSAGKLPPELGDPAAFTRAMEITFRAMEAREAEDVPRTRELVEEAEALGADVAESVPLRFAVDWALGTVHASLGMLTRDKEALLKALPHIERGMARAEGSGLPFAGELSTPWARELDLIRAALTGDRAGPVPDYVPPPPDASMEDLYTSTLSLGMRFGLDGDPAVLDALIEELERLRVGVREGRAPRIAADALWQLAESYHLRRLLAKAEPDPEDTGVVDAAAEALTALAADVLLQSGVEHGLLAARTGASRGVRAARMAASYGRLHEAVAALELGRALVLQAASTASAVPELLEAAGRHDLAEAWRAAAGGEAPGDAGEVPGLLPSTLRREALDALGYRGEGGLLGTPTLSELADGLADAGADALLYLVAGDTAGPGLAIVVGPELGVGAGALQELRDVEDGPLARYVEAAAARDGSPHDPSLARTWEEALEELCDWAFQALGPLLGEIEERLAADGDGRRDRLPRIVLVPCGRLGIVPWHAARLPAEAAHDRLCQTAVINYAASGGQFLRTARRAPRDPAAFPVLVADPMMSLAYADTEVTTLRDVFYPQARLCGALYDEELPPGTPDTVLGFLADGTSVLHVVSHGSAGTRPTVSALDLVADDAYTPEPLTVTRLLDHGGRQEASDGPLVVLSACQTDLSMRDHDEALTLTTAFVAAGARDVVGSRWLAQDSASALLMAVFHHHLVVDGLSAVDALRAAQLWMLDPERKNPGSLRGDLLREMEQPGLERTALWAAFIHQGHPGRSSANTAEGTA